MIYSQVFEYFSTLMPIFNGFFGVYRIKKRSNLLICYHWFCCMSKLLCQFMSFVPSLGLWFESPMSLSSWITWQQQRAFHMQFRIKMFKFIPHFITFYSSISLNSSKDSVGNWKKTNHSLNVPHRSSKGLDEYMIMLDYILAWIWKFCKNCRSTIYAN